jgi:hypothetical protein
MNEWQWSGWMVVSKVLNVLDRPLAVRALPLGGEGEGEGERERERERERKLIIAFNGIRSIEGLRFFLTSKLTRL